MVSESGVKGQLPWHAFPFYTDLCTNCYLWMLVGFVFIFIALIVSFIAFNYLQGRYNQKIHRKVQDNECNDICQKSQAPEKSEKQIWLQNF